MLRIAKSAVQVTAAEAHKDSGRPGMEALALKGVKYFVYLIHSQGARLGTRDYGTRGSKSRVSCPLIKVLRRIVLDVRRLIIPRLPHVGAIAVRDGVHNPLGQVLSRWVEVQHLVDVGMVDLAVDKLFDQGEVAHHTIAVKLFGTAIHVDLPVVAMKVLALALIVEVELVASRYFKGFSYVIHIQLVS